MASTPIPFSVRVIDGAVVVGSNDRDTVVVQDGTIRVVRVGAFAGVTTFFDLSDTDFVTTPLLATHLAQFDGTNWVNVPTSAVGVTSHLALTDIGTNTHAAIDTHIADGSIHFADAAADDQHYARRNNAWIEFSPSSGAGLLSGVWRFSTSTTPPPASGRFQFDAASFGATTEIDIHDFTRPGVDASNFLSLLDVGDRLYIQDETNSDDWVIMDVTGPAVDNTTYWTIPVSSFQEGTFFSNNRDCIVVIQFGGGPGGISHLDLTDIGTNTHAAIDTHIADGTIHFTEASIDHTAIQNIGTNTHAAIDTHIADASIHFTEGSIDHGSIAGLADDDHLQYALLAGRSGGQTLHGGTLATNQLNLRGSSNADRGIIELRSPVEIPFDYTETPTQNVITYNPTIPASGGAVTSFILVNPDITIDSGLFIAATVRDIGTYNQGVSPGFAVQTVFLGQPTMETTTAGVQPNQSFMFASQALYENVGAGNVATHVSNIIGMTHLPRLGTRVSGDVLNVTNITGMQVSAGFATVPGSTINFGTIRGLLMQNPTVGLFQPQGGTEGMDGLIGVDVLAIPFGGNVLKVALRSQLVAASNTRFLQNLSTAASTFGSSVVHFNDNAGVIQFGGTLNSADFSLFWSSAGYMRLFFWSTSDEIQLSSPAADRFLFNSNSGSTNGEFNFNCARFSLGAQTGSVGNQVGIFVAGTRATGLGGDWSDFLLTQAGNLTVNHAMGTVAAWTINAPSITLGTGSVTTGVALLVGGNPNQGTDRVGLKVISNPSGGTNNYAIHQSNTGGVTRLDGRLDINRGIALGGGAVPTLGTIGGSGPTAAAQSQWVEIDIGGTAHWIAVWV